MCVFGTFLFAVPEPVWAGEEGCTTDCCVREDGSLQPPTHLQHGWPSIPGPVPFPPGVPPTTGWPKRVIFPDGGGSYPKLGYLHTVLML